MCVMGKPVSHICSTTVELRLHSLVAIQVDCSYACNDLTLLNHNQGIRINAVASISGPQITIFRP